MARFTRRQRAFIFLFVLLASVVLTGAVLLHPLGPHLRAMSLLLRFSDAHAQGLPARFANHPFKEEDGYALTPHGAVRYRTYTPQDMKDPGGVVLLHGVHHLGIEDPRMWALARALAGAGVLVMTPELQDLADYRVTARTIDVIGDSAVALSTRMRRRVGVLGLSFAGGLALLAANRKEFGDSIGFVVAIGAHDDMGRVARFFAANVITRPDGIETPFQAHEYGALVLAYSHLEDFFSAADVPIAREALRQWLWEQPDAMKTAAALSPAGKRELDQLLHHRDQLRESLLRESTLHKDEMDAVSPHGHLAQVHTEVFLLHGAGDTIIPSSETLWLAKDVPAAELKASLVSPALVHVDMGDKVTWQQQWQLVDFMAQVLDAAEKLPALH
ncbi:MAG TPA: alpha/beta hydrolase [Candidatus Dormibacteraeota bacterium]|nr:alpha/beta hydrolase [Candidatus Dormibacteraeota bacterium]